MQKLTLSRRSVLQSSTAAGMAFSLSMPAIAATRTVKFTLPWLAQGTSVFPFVGKQKGFFASRGIDLQISRGFGSLPAAQAIAAGQFDFGLVISAPLVLMLAKGLPLKGLATLDYDALMGVGVLTSSPIKAPSDLIGKKIASVPASADAPFFPAYAKRAGLDASKVSIVDVDPKLLERTLSSAQVDAVTGVASSSLPVLLSTGNPARWMLYSAVGMPTYGTAVVSSKQVVEADPGLAKALVDGILESVAYTLNNPDEAAELFFKEVPEAGLTPNSHDFIRIGMGLHRFAITKPEAMTNGLGFGDIKTFDAITDLVMTYLATPDMKRPSVESWYSNPEAPVKLSGDQWAKINSGLGEYRNYVT